MIPHTHVARRIGLTKVFLRGNVHQSLESQRERRITQLLIRVQALARMRYSRGESVCTCARGSAGAWRWAQNVAQAIQARQSGQGRAGAGG